MMVSLLGCWGARSENRPMLGIYAFILIILIVCQFAIGVAVYVQQDQAPVVLRAAWNIANNYEKVLIQNQLGCCGLDAFNKTAPAGVDPTLVSGLAGQPCPTVFYVGDKKATCMQPMLDQISSSYVTVGVVAVVFAFIQVRVFSPLQLSFIQTHL